jgi:hypothetical protein
MPDDLAQISANVGRKIPPSIMPWTMPERLRRGEIVDYPYLWRWQSENDPGKKVRPVCMILIVTDKMV